jgi:hypothetical protein
MLNKIITPHMTSDADPDPAFKLTSVADPDLGSSAVLTSGSGIRKKNEKKIRILDP